MQIVRDPADVSSIGDPELRHLIEKTIRDISPDGPYDPAELGYFLIVEPGDSLDTISKQIGFDILCNRWTGIRYDQPGYTQSFECLNEFDSWYEVAFIISDDGFGVDVFVTKSIDVPELIAMCKRYATPAPTPADCASGATLSERGNPINL